MSAIDSASMPRTRPWALFGARVALPVLGLCAIAWLLRLGLSAHSGASLHVDEAQYWDWSRSLQWGYYSKPPGIALLIAASRSLFGDGETALRALTLACWPLCAWVLAWLTADMARLSVQPRRAGIWAALIVLTSPMASLLGLVATTDAPLVLCWALALASLWIAVMHRGATGWVAFGVALAAGLLCKYTMAALWPGAMLFVLLVGRRGDGARFVAASLGAALLLLPHLAWNQSAGWPTWLHTADITLAATASTSWPDALGRLVLFVAGQGLLLAPLLWPLWLMDRPLHRPAAIGQREVALFLVTTSLPLSLAGLLQAWRSGAQLNWIAPAHLALAVALALTLSAAPRSVRRVAIAALAVQAAAMACLCMAPVWSVGQGRDWPAQLDVWSRMRGWPEALGELRPLLDAHAGVPVVLTTRTLAAHTAYHWRGWEVDRAAWQAGSAPRHHYELSCPWRPGASPIDTVLVLSEGEVPPALASQGSVRPLHRARRPGGSGQSAELHLSLLELSHAGTPSVPSPQPDPAAQTWCR